VFADTPAAETGLKSGDVIVKFGDQSVTTPQSLQLAVEQSSVGSEIPVEIVRDGESMTLTYTAQEQPTDFDAKAKKQVTDSVAPSGRYGLEVAPLDSDIAKQLGVKASEGVVIMSVASGSPADEAGLEPGMVIAEVNRTKVNSPNDFAKMLEESHDKSGDSVLLLVRSDRGSRFVVLKAN
jgi:serine protease Do